jgi:hypothetical protein
MLIISFYIVAIALASFIYGYLEAKIKNVNLSLAMSSYITMYNRQTSFIK